MLAKVHSPPRPQPAGRGCALVGLPLGGGAVVEGEANLNPRALPQLTLVGLPDAAVKDWRERAIGPAMANSGLMYPHGRLTVNLAPADLRKEGPAYDLPTVGSALSCRRSAPRPLRPASGRPRRRAPWSASSRSTARCATPTASCRWPTWRRSWVNSRSLVPVPDAPHPDPGHQR